MSAPAPESQWYYVNDEDQVGPLAKDQLIRAVEKGIVKPDTLVWRNGLKDWVEASQVKFLSFASANPFAVTGRDSDEEEDEEQEEDPRQKKKKKRKRVEYGSFWNRFVGNFVDNFIVSIIFYAIFIIGVVLFSAAGNKIDPDSGAINIIMFSLFSIIYVIYFSCLESSPAQATLGKMAAGIKVVDVNGDRIGFLQAIGRCFLRLIFGTAILIGFFIMPFTPKKQALHDLIAGTFVVKK